jgi:alkanesulfonate monooxygenase SsuD/methylene tetrahydromethanopterin reductase-like flavin-dependent oxidoreductase (luciferase family)
MSMSSAPRAIRFGAFLPYIIPRAIDRRTFFAWCRRIDEGPFDVIAHGERTRWHTLDHFTMLAAMAVTTERVRLWSYVVNLPMHPVAFLAKRAASVDVLSDGRYTMTAGIGGRPQDWLASEKPLIRFPHATMDAQIAELRRIWSGEAPADGGERIFPLPVQPGGPPIMCSALRPKGLARAAVWAGGYSGFISEQHSNSEQALQFLTADARRVREAWSAAGRRDVPFLSTACFYGLGTGAGDRLAAVGAAYRKNRNAAVTGGEFWVHSAAAVRDVVAIGRQAEFDQVIFIPTNDDIGELDELAAILGDLTQPAPAPISP